MEVLKYTEKGEDIWKKNCSCFGWYWSLLILGLCLFHFQFWFMQLLPDINVKKPSVSALFRWKDRRGIYMYATVYVCIRRNTSKILRSCYCLKPVVKLTLNIWNDTIKLNILQGRLHKILFWYEVRILYFIPRLRINRQRHKKSKMDSWSVFFCLAKCFDMYQIQLR